MKAVAIGHEIVLSFSAISSFILAISFTGTHTRFRIDTDTRFKVDSGLMIGLHYQIGGNGLLYMWVIMGE
jgi:hypothetical protein